MNAQLAEALRRNEDNTKRLEQHLAAIQKTLAQNTETYRDETRRTAEFWGRIIANAIEQRKASSATPPRPDPCQPLHLGQKNKP